MLQNHPSNREIPFVPCSPTIAAVLVEVNDHGVIEGVATLWPVIGYEVHLSSDGPRYFAVVLHVDGEALPLHELVGPGGNPGTASGNKMTCLRFEAIA